MKKLLILMLLFTNVFAFAQEKQTDKKAQQILKRVSNKYKAFKSVKATFAITVEKPQEKNIEAQKGTIYLKGKKYKLQIAGQDVISDGVTRWTYLKDANEIQIDNQKTDENAITPANVFTLYEKGFFSKFTGEEKVNGKVYQLIELVPIDPKKKNITKVKLKINKKDDFIANAKIFDRNGSTQTINVDQFTPNSIKDDAIFTFNSKEYPGAEVVDLR
jgi:outer membrane lipoprotein-sorting protein